jgi:hypothetical protein
MHRPDLLSSANDAFVAAMHVTATAAALTLAAGAVLLIVAFRSRRRPPSLSGDPVPVRVGSNS